MYLQVTPTLAALHDSVHEADHGEQRGAGLLHSSPVYHADSSFCLYSRLWVEDVQVSRVLHVYPLLLLRLCIPGV